MSEKLPPLSPEKQRIFNEFIWRELGRLDGSQWRDLLDPNTELGKAARAFYAALAEGKSWDQMVEYLAPMGSTLAPEHLPQSDAINIPTTE